MKSAKSECRMSHTSILLLLMPHGHGKPGHVLAHDVHGVLVTSFLKVANPAWMNKHAVCIVITASNENGEREGKDREGQAEGV